MRRLFPSQLDTEIIYLVTHEHWARLAIKVIIWLMLAMALVVFKIAGPQIIPDLFADQAGQITTLIMQLYSLFLLLGLFVIAVMHYLNIQIITSLRIVDVSQAGLFSHVVSELHIDKIEDVTSEIKGILGTMFDYGMVYIQTAGTKERFEFWNVPHPGQIEKLVLGLYEENSNFAKRAADNSTIDLIHQSSSGV